MENQPNDNWEAQLKSSIEELLEKMGFKGEVEVTKTEENGRESAICNIKTEESSFLIGQYGVNLDSLQHIARVVVRKKIPEYLSFTLDVNSYRQEKNESIINMAKSLASEAISERRSIIMRPMSPYERRLVHLEMAKNEKVKTESIGDGENRRVVIKPADLI